MLKKFKHRIDFLDPVKLTKNADPNNHKYSAYGKGFDSPSESSFTDGIMGKNIIILGADMRSSYILIIKGEISQFLLQDQH